MNGLIKNKSLKTDNHSCFISRLYITFKQKIKEIGVINLGRLCDL